jgi:hypothetical protein
MPSLAIRMCQAARDVEGNLPPGQAETLAALEGPSLLELGDWAGAERLLAKLPENAFAALPPPARAAAWFSRGLTEARFGVAAEKAITEALRQCARELADNAEGEFVLLPQILALEYGIFLRSGEQDLQPYLADAGNLTPRGPVADLRTRLILDLAALGIDRRQTDDVARLVPAVLSATEGAADWGLADAERTLLRLAMARSKDATGLLAAMGELDAHGSNEWHLRLVASAALAREPLDEGVWRAANEWISLKGMTFGPVGGTAIYDLVLARIGQCLAAGDLQGADATAAWALSLTCPCMAPYYARLTFTRWGVARLQGEAGQRELGEQVEAASCANRQEKALSRLFRNETQRDKAREAVHDSLEGRFWLDWLTVADRLGSAGSKDTRRSPERFAPARLPRAEQLLAKGLVEWAGRPPPGNAGQDRGKPPPL